MNVEAAVDALARAALGPLDRLRAHTLRRLGPAVAPLLAERALRVTCWSLAAVCGAFALVCVAPLVLLTLGPLVLGVPHLVGDVRYLVVRQGLHARPGLVAVVAPLLAAQWLAPSAALAWCTVAASTLFARAPVRARAVGAALALGVAGLSAATPRLAMLALSHGHNLLALGLWLAWARPSRLHVLPALLAFALGCALIVHGALDGALLAPGALSPSPVGLDAALLGRGLSPLPDPRWSLRFLLLFGFAQSVHYAVWTRLIPEEDRRREGPRSYRASYAALKADLGPRVLALCALCALAFLGLALADVGFARDGYLRFALFHGPLELCACALLWLEGGPVNRARWAARRLRLPEASAGGGNRPGSTWGSPRPPGREA